MYMKIPVKVKELGNGVTLKKAHLYWPPGNVSRNDSCIGGKKIVRAL